MAQEEARMGVGLLDDVLELAGLLRADWPAVRERIRLSGHPTCDGDPPDPDPDPPDPDPDPDDPDPDPPDPDPDPNAPPPTAAELARWKREARKWASRAKKNATARDEYATKLSEREDADKSEQEKAVEAAARTAREEAKSESEKERRADKLEMAVTKLGAVRGVKVGDGDEERVVKFADPDDVQMWLERQIELGEIDADAIYADGKVNEDALADELARLAEAKPGWLVGTSKPNGRPAGSADGGRGAAPSSDTDVEATLQKIQRGRSGASA